MKPDYNACIYIYTGMPVPLSFAFVIYVCCHYLAAWLLGAALSQSSGWFTAFVKLKYLNS